MVMVMTPYVKAMLELARRFYPAKSGYADVTDEQLLRWLAEDAADAARRVRRA